MEIIKEVGTSVRLRKGTLIVLLCIITFTTIATTVAANNISN